MKIYEKLLENLRCPCGGRDKLYFDAEIGLIVCRNCDYRIDVPKVITPIELLARHYIVTGGPIPGEIPPPHLRGYMREMDDGEWMVWGAEVAHECDARAYMLPKAERTRETLLPWLDTEVGDDTDSRNR